SGGFALQSGTVSTVLAGTGAVNKTGVGTVTLSGANTYSGNTTVSGGTLALTGAGTLGGNAGTTTVSGGTLDLGTTTQDQNAGPPFTSASLQGGSLAWSGAFALQSGTVSSVLAGTGAASKTTGGTVTLSGANTYTGGTTVTAGILQLGAGGSLAATGN